MHQQKRPLRVVETEFLGLSCEDVGRREELLDEMLVILRDWEETEWIEFKAVSAEVKTDLRGNEVEFDVPKFARYVSSLANMARINQRPCGWLIFGLPDTKEPGKARTVVGTTFHQDEPRKLGELAHHVAQVTLPGHTFRPHAVVVLDGRGSTRRVIMFQVPPAPARSFVSAKNKRGEWTFFARIGSHQTDLKEFQKEEIQRLDADAAYFAGQMAEIRNLAHEWLIKAKGWFERGKLDWAGREVEQIFKLFEIQVPGRPPESTALTSCAYHADPETPSLERELFWRIALETALLRVRICSRGDAEEAEAPLDGVLVALKGMKDTFHDGWTLTQLICFTMNLMDAAHVLVESPQFSNEFGVCLGVNRRAMAMAQNLLDESGGLVDRIGRDTAFVDLFAETCSDRAKLLLQVAECDPAVSPGPDSDDWLDFMTDDELRDPSRAALILCETAIDQLATSRSSSLARSNDRANTRDKTLGPMARLLLAKANVLKRLGHAGAAADCYCEAFNALEGLDPDPRYLEVSLACVIDWQESAAATDQEATRAFYWACHLLVFMSGHYGRIVATARVRDSARILNATLKSIDRQRISGFPVELLTRWNDACVQLGVDGYLDG
jgi:hypothetical protein